MKHIILSCLFLALSLPVFAQTNQGDVVDFGPPETLQIQTADKLHDFTIEVARTSDQQARGMMFRETMDDDAGMLFAFEDPKVATIWMKNTAIALDILFVRSNGKILKIEHLHQPYSLRSASSESVVAAVVELRGGRAKELGIRPGDVVQHEFFTK